MADNQQHDDDDLGFDDEQAALDRPAPVLIVPAHLGVQHAFQLIPTLRYTIGEIREMAETEYIARHGFFGGLPTHLTLGGVALDDDAEMRLLPLMEHHYVLFFHIGVNLQAGGGCLMDQIDRGGSLLFGVLAGNFDSLLPSADYKDKVKEQAWKMLEKNLSDDNPVVRLAAAYYFIKMAKLSNKKSVVHYYVPIISHIVRDSSADIRMLAAKAAGSLTDFPCISEFKDILAEVTTKCFEDKSSAVRLSIIEEFEKVFSILSDENALLIKAVDVLFSILIDADDYVRCKAIGYLKNLFKMSMANGQIDLFQSKLEVSMSHLENSGSYGVRKSLAAAIPDMIEFIDWQFATKHLIPTYVKLLNDSMVIVRLAAMRGLIKIIKKANQSNFIGVLGAVIVDLAGDKNCRIRFELLEMFLAISNILGPDDFNEVSFLDVLVKFLGDKECRIQKCAADNLKSLVAVFGIEWTISNMIPKIQMFAPNFGSLILEISTACGVVASVVVPSVINTTGHQPELNLQSLCQTQTDE